MPSLREAVLSRPHLVALVAALALFAFLGERHRDWTYDDTYIFLRYADHVVDGTGPVYNAGERVEGYTSFLYMMLLAGGRALGVPPVLLVKGVGFLFGALTLLLAAHVHRFVPGATCRTSAIAVLLTVLAGPFPRWCFSGMDVAMAGFLALAAVLAHARARGPDGTAAWRRWTAALCALAAMCRPEFALLTAVLAADWLVWGVRRRDASAIDFAIVVAATFGPYFAWRWSYYGWPLPNSFYAKASWGVAQAERGLHAMREVAGRSVVPFVLLAIATATRRLGSLTAPAIWFALHCAYVVGIGGDPNRYYAIALPVGAVAAGVAVGRVTRRPAVVVAVLLAAIAVEGINIVRRDFRHVHRRAARSNAFGRAIDVGMWLRENAAADAVIAVNAAGEVPYYSGLRVIDMLGINDEYIAHGPARMGSGAIGHEKTDAEYILARKPDYIQFGAGRGRGLPLFVSDAALFRTHEFRRWYALRTVDLPEGKRTRLYERLPAPRSRPEWEAERSALRSRGRSREDAGFVPRKDGAITRLEAG